MKEEKKRPFDQKLDSPKGTTDSGPKIFGICHVLAGWRGEETKLIILSIDL